MQVTNECNFPVKAFCFHKKYGYGECPTIAPGAAQDIQGPYVGQMDGSFCAAILGSITCRERANNSENQVFQVCQGTPLAVAVDTEQTKGVVVLHHEDEIPVYIQVRMAMNHEQARAMV